MTIGASTETVFNEPACVLTYGPSGAGKTTDLIYSFPRFLFIAGPGALKPEVNQVGVRVAKAGTIEKPVRTLGDAIALTKQAAKMNEEARKKGKEPPFDGVVIDDFSLAADATTSDLEQNYPLSKKGEKDGNAFWAEIRRIMLELRDGMRFCGMHLVANAHERGPHTDQKKGYVKGGPMVPGTMPDDLPKSFDTVLRVCYDAAAPLWPYVYHCDKDDVNYNEKDRHGLCPLIAPLNIGEILRSGFGPTSKFPIRRAVGLEWQEDVVEKVAQKLAGIPFEHEEHRKIRQWAIHAIETKYTKDERHIVWTVRDAVHRAIIRDLQRKSRLAALLASGSASTGGI